MRSINKGSLSRGSVKSQKREEEIEEINAKREEMRENIEDFLDAVYSKLDAHGCNEVVAVEVEESNSPFFTPPKTVIVETEEECARKSIYKYVREMRNHEEKIKIVLKYSHNLEELAGFYVSGTLLDYSLFEIIVQLFKSMRTLTVLRLVDCSIKAEAIMILGKELGKTTITHLYLDRNPVVKQNYYCLLQNNQVLQHLSLVQCHMDAKGAKLLGQELGPPAGDRPTHTLKFLNLNSNRLDCRATKYIAQGLKWNRDLVFLSLAGNKISNAGLEYISKSLRTSTLEKWEKKLREERRRLRYSNISNLLKEDMEACREEVEFECPPLKDSDDQSLPTNDLYQKSHIESIIEEYWKNDSNPITGDVMNKNGKLITTGNKTLRILDISYNKIEEAGFEHLLVSLKHQQKERRHMSEIDREKYHLHNVKLVGNFYPENSRVLSEIEHCLRGTILEEDYLEDEVIGEDEAPGIDEMQNLVEGKESLSEGKHLNTVPIQTPTKKHVVKKKIVKEVSRQASEEKMPFAFDDLITLPSESVSEMDAESTQTDEELLSERRSQKI